MFIMHNNPHCEEKKYIYHEKGYIKSDSENKGYTEEYHLLECDAVSAGRSSPVFAGMHCLCLPVAWFTL
jgi:hypothetical protein